jgi:hypothetical protein
VLKDLIAVWKRGERCGEKISGMDSVLKKEKSDRINQSSLRFASARRVDWIFFQAFHMKA